jgi:membrane protease YdiL (CAAX protease family)
LTKYRVQAKWYVAALLIAPFTVFATLLILSLISPVFLPGIFTSGDNQIASMFGLADKSRTMFLLFVVILGLFNGFVEELGWTGFLTPRLGVNHNLVARGLNVGVMWGLWHLLSNYLGSAPGAGTVSLPLYLAVILFSFLPPFRILMTWVHDHTGSLFVAIIMHASLDVFWILSTPNALTGQHRVTWYITWAAVLWLIVATISILRNKKRVS